MFNLCCIEHALTKPMKDWSKQMEPKNRLVKGNLKLLLLLSRLV